MDDFNSETDSDYTSYWRDWVCNYFRIDLEILPGLWVAIPQLWPPILLWINSRLQTYHRTPTNGAIVHILTRK